jgi:pimeloyl-ACP methyl ester carboxylesterase
MPTLELSAGTVEYEDTGDGPPIVFVHGLIMDSSLWRKVVAELSGEFRCLAPTLPLGGHRLPMRPDADLSMPGIAGLLEEMMVALELHDCALVMNDWGGAQLLIGGPQDARIGRLALCSCEAFDNVPPKGAAKLLPFLGHVPGGLALALGPLRFDALRRLPMTYGPLSKRPVPREVMDRWFAPIVHQREIRRDLRKYVISAPDGRRRLLGAAERLRAFERPALVAWAREDKLMPREHGPRLAALLPQGRLEEIEDSFTLIPEDQPLVLAGHLRELMRR